jgi:hypothetical protein
MVAHEELLDMLEYYPRTGDFLWREHRSNRCSVGDAAGWTTRSGHIRIKIYGRSYLAHRLAWFYVKGVWPSLLDHINQNPADNRIVNLREASRRLNRLNSKINSNNKSGYAGVCWHAATHKWRVCVNVDKKQKHIGVFVKLEDAVAARKAAIGR